MSFASEPGRDDGNLPPLNVVIPDDARELERDVLAYHREMRAQRRRQRFAWLVRPFSKSGGPAAMMPLIAACLALSLVGGALLSVITMSPASAPTLGSTSSAQPSVSLTRVTLPPVDVMSLGGRTVPVRSLGVSAIALVPVNCGCGSSLSHLAAQAAAAQVSLYFVGTGHALPQVITLAQQDGAMALDDPGNVLGAAYHPVGLTVLLVFNNTNGTAEVARQLPAGFTLSGTLSELTLPGPDAR